MQNPHFAVAKQWFLTYGSMRTKILCGNLGPRAYIYIYIIYYIHTYINIYMITPLKATSHLPLNRYTSNIISSFLHPPKEKLHPHGPMARAWHVPPVSPAPPRPSSAPRRPGAAGLPGRLGAKRQPGILGDGWGWGWGLEGWGILGVGWGWGSGGCGWR